MDSLNKFHADQNHILHKRIPISPSVPSSFKVSRLTHFPFALDRRNTVCTFFSSPVTVAPKCRIFDMAPNVGGKVYIVEHLDPELGPWSELEYIAIAEESQESGSSFTLSSISPDFKVPEPLKAIPVFKATQSSVENIYAANKNSVCLLDPSAEKDLSPEDAQEFGAFLFGGILGEFGFFHAPRQSVGVRRNMQSANSYTGDDPPRGTSGDENDPTETVTE